MIEICKRSESKMDEYEYDDIMYGDYDFAYADGWYDVMTGYFNPYRYHKDFAYADGVEDADYHLWKKRRMVKWAYAY